MGKVVAAVLKTAGVLLEMILKVSPPYHPNNLTRLLLERLSGLGKSSQSLSSEFSTLPLRLSTHLSP